MSTAIATKPKEERDMTFVPFGAADSIKLSVEIVKNLIAVPTKSGQTCTDRDAMKFMMLCRAQRLNPFAGDAFLIGYDSRDGGEPSFSLITAHVAFLKRAETHPEFDGMKSGIIVVDEANRLTEIEGDFHLPEQTVVGGWATVYFKNRKYPITRKVRLSRFQKGFGVWKDDPAGMICKVAESDSLRSSFPTLIGGLYMQEELNPSEAGAVIEMVQAPKQTAPNFDGPALPKPEPQKALVAAAAEPEPTPAAPVQSEPASETLTLGTPQEHLLSILVDNKVDPALFINYISVNGVDKKHGEDACKYYSINEFPDALCGNLAADKAMMARVITKFGKK